MSGLSGTALYWVKIAVAVVVCGCLAMAAIASFAPDEPPLLGPNRTPPPTPSYTPAPDPPPPTFSRSPLPTLIAPNVVGLNATAATRRVKEAGFTRPTTCVDPADDDVGFEPTAEFTVTAQDPAAGSAAFVDFGSFLLYCARAR
jgi:hypothetical protein